MRVEHPVFHSFQQNDRKCLLTSFLQNSFDFILSQICLRQFSVSKYLYSETDKRKQSVVDDKKACQACDDGCSQQSVSSSLFISFV